MTAQVEALCRRYPDLEPCKGSIEQAIVMLVRCYGNGGKVLVCGNGGSASDSEHVVGELMKGFMKKRPVPSQVQTRLVEMFGAHGEYLANQLQGALPAISLVSHTALLTAIVNDVADSMVFAQQVYGYGRPGDVLIGLSTSGNSKNVIHAMQVAKAQGLRTIGLTGASGGEMNDVCDVIIKVPYQFTPEIQERHLPIYHTICIALEEEFFDV
ncbi:SIS domain-containing protein [Alicyclobacillus curvatus]|jgi:D-sedoheptulose 7-phosphate isomerase|nr:SIS domain-containing protein [Alicyclobacillus curvatus]